MHHAFDARHPDTWNWTVGLSFLLAGMNITFTATTYCNDEIGPDPYPSPGGKFPCTATDAQVHKYAMAGTYTLTLKVSDDDGGVREIPLFIVLN